MGSKIVDKRQPLSQALLVEEAISLADTEGLHTLTMRNLAERLGYKVMALYNHISNKDDLLALMADAVAAEIELPPEPKTQQAAEQPTSTTPLAQVRAIAVANHALFGRHPWASALWLQQLPGPIRTTHTETLLRLLHESDLPPDVAHHAFHAVTNHVVGYTLQQQGMALGDAGAMEARAKEFLNTVPADSHPFTIAHVHQHLNGETSSSFELVLDLILDGLTAMARKS